MTSLNQFMKTRIHLNVTFVIIVFLTDDISTDILNQFMNERSHSNVMTAMQIFLNKEIANRY